MFDDSCNLFRTNTRLWRMDRHRSTSNTAFSIASSGKKHQKLCGRPPQYAPAPAKLTFDLLTLKVMSESRTCDVGYLCAISVFLGLSVLDLGPVYATDRRQTNVRRPSSLNVPAMGGGCIIIPVIKGPNAGTAYTTKLLTMTA